jgi:hypothetical protein
MAPASERVIFGIYSVFMTPNLPSDDREAAAAPPGRDSFKMLYWNKLHGEFPSLSCPECGARVVPASGCYYCRECGWGKCG